MRRLFVNRFYTKLVGVFPQTDRDKHNLLAAVTDSGQTTLTATFTRAIDTAETAADAAYQVHVEKRQRASLRTSRSPHRGSDMPPPARES